MKDTTLSWQWHGTRWPCMSNIFIIASMNILAGRSTKTLRRVLFFVMHRETIHWMWRTNANAIEGGQGAQWAGIFFRRGCTTKRLWPGEMSYFGGQIIQNPLTAQDQKACRDAFPRSGTAKLEQLFILELQEHVKGKCVIWRTGLEGLEVDFILPQGQSA